MLAGLPPVSHAFGYGSAVLPQPPSSARHHTTSENSRGVPKQARGQAQPSVVDFVLVVECPAAWHTENMAANPQHYAPHLRALGQGPFLYHPSSSSHLASCKLHASFRDFTPRLVPTIAPKHRHFHVARRHGAIVIPVWRSRSSLTDGAWLPLPGPSSLALLGDGVSRWRRSGHPLQHADPVEP